MTTSENASQTMLLPVLFICLPGHNHLGEKTQTAVSEGEYSEQTDEAEARTPGLPSQQKDTEDQTPSWTPLCLTGRGEAM